MGTLKNDLSHQENNKRQFPNQKHQRDQTSHYSPQQQNVDCLHLYSEQLKVVQKFKQLPAVHVLALLLLSSARSFSTSRAIEITLFSIACLCSISAILAFFS